MKRNFVYSIILALVTLPMAAQAGGENRAAEPQAVPYATANQVNALMSQLEATSLSTAADLSRLRINKWKAPSEAKQQAENNRESILRNLQSAMPGMIGAVRANPDDVAASFKLYRNLDALYDVLSSIAESAGAFGPKNEYQSLANDVNSVDQVRHDTADRVENLASSKETELARLRGEIRAAQAAAAAAPPKKVIVDDNAPVKKPVRKKRATKRPAKPASGQAAQTPPSPQPPKGSSPQ